MRFMIIGKGGVNAAVIFEFFAARRCRREAHDRSQLSIAAPRISAKKTAALDEPLGGKLRLFFLPRYSPNRNPDELAAIRLLCTLSRELASRFRGNDVALV